MIKGESWLKVTLCMPESMISGFVSLDDEERLLDVLNGVATRRVESRSKSLEMVDVEVRKPDGREESRPTLYVNKPSISLAAIWEPNGGRGVFTRTGIREYPFVEKLAVPVRVQLPAFSLVGKIHLGPGQMASDLLEEQAVFLPMTDTKVQPLTLLSAFWSDVAFVAVNRQQILSLEQEDIPLLKVQHGRG